MVIIHPSLQAKSFRVLFFFLAFSLNSNDLSAQFLEISSNQRFLVDEEGEPFFWLGDTGWEMLHRLDREQIDYYMKDRADKGFTVIQTVILSEIYGLTVPNMEGALPFEDFDLTRPNESYFELVDYAITKAKEYGLVLALLPTWHKYVLPGSHPLKKEAAVINESNAYIYGKYLGERYKDASNILWILGGDWPAEPQIEVWNAMAEGLDEGDGGRHLMTYHPRGYQTSSTWLHQSPWLDFNMMQTGHTAPSFPVYDWVLNDYSLFPVKPVINGEPAYEDLPIHFSAVNGRYDDYEVRKQAYWSVFAGAFGHTYGNNNVWQMNKEEGEGWVSANKIWIESLQAPGSGQMRHLRSLMESRPFLERIPDQDLLLRYSHPHASDHLQVTRDGSIGKKNATYMMAYLPYYRDVYLNTTVIASDSLKIWWYCPATGEVLLEEEVENTGELYISQWKKRFEEGQGGPDWVVVIDDPSRGYGAPGK